MKDGFLIAVLLHFDSTTTTCKVPLQKIINREILFIILQLICPVHNSIAHLNGQSLNKHKTLVPSPTLLN